MKQYEAQRIEDAREYYKQGLLRRWILGTFKKLIHQRDQKYERVQAIKHKYQKMTMLKKLRHACEISQYEKQKEMERLEELADSFLEFNLQTKAVQSLRQNRIESVCDKDLFKRKVYEKHLLKRTLNTWIKLQKYIRDENRILEEQRQKIVSRFRTIKIARKVLEALGDHAQT